MESGRVIDSLEINCFKQGHGAWGWQCWQQTGKGHVYGCAVKTERNSIGHCHYSAACVAIERGWCFTDFHGQYYDLQLRNKPISRI